MYIEDGNCVDVVFVAGHAIGEYKQVGLRLMADASPFVAIDALTNDLLQQISPGAAELAKEWRRRIAG